MSRQGYLAYIGTNSVRGSKGIYTLSVDADTLRSEIIATHQEYNTGSIDLSADERFLYAACEGMTFRGHADGGIIGFATGVDGSLTEIGSARSHGQRTCCVSVDESGKKLYACNFYAGTFAAFNIDKGGAPSEAYMVVAPPPVPGAWRALHCVKPIGEDYIGVISLAECALVIYEAASGRRVTSYEFPGHPFCRYLEVCGRRIYALMQDPGDVYVFENNLDENGSIKLLQRISIQPDCYMGRFGATTIRATPNEALMLCATREVNTITMLKVHDDGTLERSSIVTLPGKTPRDFNISRDGEIVVTALQASDEVCVHRIDYENATLAYTEGCKVGVPSPAAVAVSRRSQ